jgi:hypothetical protein
MVGLPALEEHHVVHGWRPQPPPGHLHAASEVLVAGILDGANVVVAVDEPFDHPQLGRPSGGRVVGTLEGDAGQCEVHLDLGADALEHALVDLLEQHVELGVRDIQVVAEPGILTPPR